MEHYELISPAAAQSPVTAPPVEWKTGIQPPTKTAIRNCGTTKIFAKYFPNSFPCSIYMVMASTVTVSSLQ